MKDKVAELFESGMSYSMVGASLGINRYQVAGIINRLRKSGVKIKRTNDVMIRRFPKVKVVVEPVVVSAITNIDHEPRNVKIGVLDLGFFDCKYPVESEGSVHWFCGDPVAKGSSYCSTHHTLCWVPSKPSIKKHGIRR